MLSSVNAHNDHVWPKTSCSGETIINLLIPLLIPEVSSCCFHSVARIFQKKHMAIDQLIWYLSKNTPTTN